MGDRYGAATGATPNARSAAGADRHRIESTFTSASKLDTFPGLQPNMTMVRQLC